MKKGRAPKQQKPCAPEALRTLIEEIWLVPKDGRLQIGLYGELATILALTNETPASQGRDGRSALLIAGACNQRYLPLIQSAIPPAPPNGS